MPITLPEIAKHLATIGWKYKVDEEQGHAMLGFGTTHHADLDGDKHIAIWIEVEAEGAVSPSEPSAGSPPEPGPGRETDPGRP